MSDTKFLFEFLEPLNQEASQNGLKLEKLIYEDPQSACFNGRLVLESIVDDVIRKERIDDVFLNKLYEKIIYLDRQGILTREVKQNMDTVRSIGNQAAHKASFDDIEDAIKVFKGIYRVAVWYIEVYSDQTIEVPKYRNPNPPNLTPNTAKVDQDLINQILTAIHGTGGAQPKEPVLTRPTETEIETENVDKVSKNEESTGETLDVLEIVLPEGKSYLLKELKKLQESSQEAVESPEAFSKFKKYMHVERKIQKDLESILEEQSNKNGPSLVLLCGSVGDGKSHLLSYIKQNKPELIEGYRLYNDATESFNPEKSAIETLSEHLTAFSDDEIESSSDRIILAINLGVLNNFIESEHKERSFNKLKEFIYRSDIFGHSVTTKYSDEEFHILSFSDYQSFELTEEVPTSEFLSAVFKKVFNENCENPFYLAYKQDEERKMNRVIHENFRFMMNETVQYHVIQLIIQTIVENKLVISARALFNFIADCIIPEGYRETNDIEWNPMQKLNNTTPNLLFTRKERSYILKVMSELDPVNRRVPETDQILIDLNTIQDWGSIVDDLIDEKIADKWLKKFIHLHEDLRERGETFTSSSEEEFSSMLIRSGFLTSTELNHKITPKSYKHYLHYLYHFNKKTQEPIQDFYNQVKEAVFRWKGSPKRNYIYLGEGGEKFKVAQALPLRASINHIQERHEDTLYSFKQTITLAYHGGNVKDATYLDVDFTLYKLLLNVISGYCPNKKDEEDAIQFVEFIDRVMKFGNHKEELLIHIPGEKKMYKLSKNDFSGYVFERE
ncbi:DNA phosphorothioation-dependent restriction protein DptF [Halalkalibacter okhensis]|uniref:DUF4145 domain-containing protein n=1 Tax=Halalkalibacter okhensis TaxID=333138 RepID=A0A0B0IJQ4_9BACI|nr:DNA phosphorothioation-dependent restriction protein DptF [Halalkalibacter okhensis]KHF41550.1 hypothetical protein LQ50_02220 [Halalkalibacter okhensis]